MGNQCGLSADLCVLVCYAVCWAISLRTVKKATPLQYVCVPVCHACVCALMPACAQHILTLISAGVLVLDGLFISPSYPNVAKLCSHNHPPSTDEQICLLLTKLDWGCHSRMATLQGCAVLGCHFPDCHSCGKHLLFCVAVMKQEHTSQSCSPPLLPSTDWDVQVPSVESGELRR